MKILSKIAIVFISSALAGCTLYSKPKVPEFYQPKKFKYELKYKTAKLDNQWWKGFHDPELNDLIDHALKYNTSYQSSIKNIQIACTYINQYLSSLYPQVDLNFSSTRNKLTAPVTNSYGNTSFLLPKTNAPVFNLQTLTGTVNYELDVWNQLRNTVKQAEANQFSAEANTNIVRLTLITTIVSTYYQIIALNETINNLQQQSYYAGDLVKINQSQFTSGLIDAGSLDNAKTQAESIKTNLINAKKEKEVLINTLAYLVGTYPESFKFVSKGRLDKIAYSHMIPAGIPSQVVANRPDIQQAFYQVMSYGYLEKQNIASFLPSINLTGSYGYAAKPLSNLITSANSYWNYGVFAAQYLYDFQTRWSIYKRSKYQYEQAVLNYRDTVLNAYKEVDSALVSFQHDDAAMRSVQHQTTYTRDQAQLAQAQYRSGLSDYSGYVTARMTYLQTDNNLINQRLVVVQDVIQVYKTLGLGIYA